MPTSYLRAVLLSCCLLGVLGEPAAGQLPSGGIVGSVSDSTGAVVPDVRLVARSVVTGLERATETDQRGSFSFPLLPPGVYELNVEAEGFQNPRKRIVVQTGATTRVEIELAVDVLEQVVEALDTLPELRYDWHGIDGLHLLTLREPGLLACGGS